MSISNQSKMGRMERFAVAASVWTGSSWAFGISVATVALWLGTGPIFGFSDTWQLVINTATSILTFLMVFLIQRSQNKDFLSMQLKLNELVAAVKGASNRLINVEDLSEEETRVLHDYYQRLADLTCRKESIKDSHSVEDAAERHLEKELEQQQAGRVS